MKKYILILLSLFSYISAVAQVNEQNLSPLLSFDGEPYLAVNPADPDNIIAGWMRLRLDGRIWIAVRNSFDNGQTWGNYQFLPHTDTGYHSADVSIEFHGSGTAYLSYVDVDWSDTTAFVYVTKSIDGGVSWSSLSRVDNEQYPAGQLPLCYVVIHLFLLRYLIRLYMPYGRKTVPQTGMFSLAS